MSRAVLIDTSAWVEAMRRRGDEALRGQVKAALWAGRARFCDFVRLELWNGVSGDAERSWLTELEETVETVPTTLAVWAEAKKLAQESRRRGLTLPASDLLIAACAAAHGLDLLHRDKHLDALVPASFKPE